MILNWFLWLPALGALALLFIPGRQSGVIRWISLAVSTGTFLLGLTLLCWFDSSIAAPQMTFGPAPWIPMLNVNYHVGLDGINLWLVLLTAFLTPLIILGSASQIGEKVKEYHVALLVIETALIGTFVSLDLFLFYCFWEGVLIPMYFIVGIWGGRRRLYATLKLVLYTALGSLLMLVAILYLGRFTGEWNFAIARLYGLEIPLATQKWLFAAFVLAFAIKVPLFPLHTWLPDAHVEAPTGGSVLLAGVLLKMGGYGLIRFGIPMFPEAVAWATPFMLTVSVIGILYGGVMALVQYDIKSLVAYSSVSHMGFVVLGLFTLNQVGVSGGLYQMINHGISTGALFFLVGMIYERTHTRRIADYGGLAAVVPAYAALFLIVTLSSIALPGTNGFVGEFLILQGTFAEAAVWGTYGYWIGALACTGVILAAAYMLWMFKRVFFGETKIPGEHPLKDLGIREWIVMIPLLAAIFGMGLFPSWFLDKSAASVEQTIEYAKGK